MDKPVVVVIENPQEDPNVYATEGIEVIELSSYPMSKWLTESIWDYGEEYAEKIEYARDRFPAGSPEWQGLDDMASEFRLRLEKALEEEENGN